MDYPLVTIFTPIYNHEKYLNDYFTSIINQTYNNIELILIDDNSKDNSVKIVEQYLELLEKRFKKVIFIKRDKNKGLIKNCNEGLNLSEGEYFITFASDDIMLPNRVERNVTFLESNPQFALVHTNGYKVNDNFEYSEPESFGNNELLQVEPEGLPEADKYFERLYLSNCIAAPTVCIRTSILKKLGGYSNKYIHEDYYLWLKIANQNFIGYLDEKLVLYRIHDSSFTHNVSLAKRMIEDNEQIKSEFSFKVKEEYYIKAKQKNYIYACMLFYGLNHKDYFKEYYNKLNKEHKNLKLFLKMLFIESHLKGLLTKIKAIRLGRNTK